MYPFSGMRDDSLSGGHFKRTVLVLDAQCPFQNDGELVKLWGLAGFEPARRTAHVGDAGSRGLGVDSSNVFIDEFGLVAGGLNARGLRDQSRASVVGFRALFFFFVGHFWIRA